MLDSYYRGPFQAAFVNPPAKLLARLKIHPTLLSIVGLLLGIAVVPLLIYGLRWWAIGALFASGYFDVIDGSVARLTGKHSPQGAALDICFDRCVEVAVVIGLLLVDPHGRGLAALLMLGSTLVCVTSFLVVGIFAQNDSEKSFHYSPGLVERTEAFILFALMMALPYLFTPLAIFFSALVLFTAALRLIQFLCAPASEESS